MKKSDNSNRDIKNRNSSSPACAACKYQRRKCQPDCPLAPHFPPTKRQDFIAAQKLFGVHNILRTIKDCNSFDTQEDAIKSMVFQGKARAADPVGGCHRMILHLQNQIRYYEAELQLVRQKLSFYEVLASGFVQKLPPVPPDTPFNLAEAMALQSIGCSPVLEEETSVVEGNSHSLQVFDGITMKVGNEELSTSCSQSSGFNGFDTETFVDLSASEKQSVAVDVSEGIKHLLGGFDENSIFLDSKRLTDCSDDVVLLEEDHKPIQQEEEEHNHQDDT